MTPRHALTLHCGDPTCDGWSGVDCVYTGDTWLSEGETLPSECPACSGPLLDPWQQLDESAALDALLDALDEHDLLPRDLTVDEHALARVVLAELRRQAAEQKHARVWTPAAIAAANAAVDAEFPPHDPPAWLTEGVTR